MKKEKMTGVGCDILPSFQDPIEPSRWTFRHTRTPERTLMKRDIQRRDAWRTTSVANAATILLPRHLIPFPSSCCSSSPSSTTDFRATLRVSTARSAFFAKETAKVRSTCCQVLSTGHERKKRPSISYKGILDREKNQVDPFSPYSL